MTDENSEARQDVSGAKGPILIAVDFSPDSEAAVLWACQYAACVNAEVVVLHVVHDPAEAPGSYLQADADRLRPMRDVATELMKTFLQKVQSDHPDLDVLKNAQTSLVNGIPATRILEMAKTTGARLIVMGSRGRTGLPHLLLGSKAERVVQMSPVPVTIVKADSNRER